MSEIADEIYQKIADRMKTEEIFGEQEYYDLIDELLDEYNDLQLVVDDDDLVEITEDLKQRWPLLSKNLSQKQKEIPNEDLI